VCVLPFLAKEGTTTPGAAKDSTNCGLEADHLRRCPSVLVMMSTTSHRRSLSRSPIGVSPASSSDRQQLSQKVQHQQQKYRRPFSESLNHPDDDHDNSGNDHHEENDDAGVAAGVLVRGGADFEEADDNDGNLAAFSPWGQFYDNHCTYLPAVREFVNTEDSFALHNHSDLSTFCPVHSMTFLHLLLLFQMAGWFFFSACLSAYNKVSPSPHWSSALGVDRPEPRRKSLTASSRVPVPARPKQRCTRSCLGRGTWPSRARCC
jgi:hypothetical protein